MVARINKLADPDLYTGRSTRHAGQWRNPSDLFRIADGSVVSNRDFLSLWRGFGPEDGWPLSQRALTRTHAPGFDIVLSPDKSISALWAISPEADRSSIEHAVLDAAAVALTETVFRHCAVTRTGKAGKNRRIETGDFLAAVFPYHVSRELDPQLDVSCVVFNFVRTHRDLKFRTLHGYPIYSWKKATGAVFRNRLAHRLRTRLGLEMERHGEHGEYTRIRHMDPALEDLWSKRKSKIRTHRTAMHAAWRTPDAAASGTGSTTNAALLRKRTVTVQDIARFAAEAAGIIDPDALHARIARTAFDDVTEQERDNVRREIDDIPRKLAAADLVFNTADIIAQVENAAGGLFDDTAMEQLHAYAFAADNLLPLEYDDPNPDAVAGMAHKRMFTTRDILDGKFDHKRLSGLSERDARTDSSTEQTPW